MTENAIKKNYTSIFNVYVFSSGKDNLLLNNKIAEFCHTQGYFKKITNSGCRRQPWIFIGLKKYQAEFPDFPN